VLFRSLGNALVGNPPDGAALEISLAGPTLQAECDLACVVYGAPFALRCEGRSLKVGTTFTLHAGEVLRIGGSAQGMRCYLCVAGGIEAPIIMGSRSSLRPVQAGERLACSPGSIASRFIQFGESWDHLVKQLRVVAGPQADWFDADDLYDSAGKRRQFTVTPASNRMGLRLQGEPIRMPARELVSEAVCPGTVQATRDGQLIILGVDGQTIGGYPKIAQVISADLDLLGQLRPGERVLFAPVSLEEAQRLYRAKQAELDEWLLRLRVAAGSGR
jgi:antagonist of KipI